jgi:hypothetical protein
MNHFWEALYLFLPLPEAFLGSIEPLSMGFFGGFFFVSLFVVVYLSICFQFNRKVPFEK